MKHLRLTAAIAALSLPATAQPAAPAAPAAPAPAAAAPAAPAPVAAAPAAPAAPAPAAPAPAAAPAVAAPAAPAPAAAAPAAPAPAAPAPAAPAPPAPVPAPELGIPTADAEDEHSPDDPQKTDKPMDYGSSSGDPWGDGQKGVAVGPLTLRFLLQTRYVATFAERSTNERPSYVVREENIAQQGDGWKVNRLFMRLAAEPSPHLGAKLILDFAEFITNNPDGAVKQAYVTLRPFPKRLEIQAGLFKLPFSIMELDAIAQYTLANLGHSDDLIKNLGFAGRDIGVMVTGAPLPKKKLLRASLGVFRGHSHDEHDSPVGAIGARLESRPVKGLRVGVDWVEHPFDVSYNRPFETGSKDILPNPPDPAFPLSRTWTRGRAWSADVTFDRWKTLVSVEAMIGNRVDYDERFGAETFGAVWAIASYRFRAGPVQLMPAARIEFFDADREHRAGLRRAISAGLNVIFTPSVRTLIDVTRTDVDPQTPALDPPRPIVIPPYYELNSTRVTAQLQVAM